MLNRRKNKYSSINDYRYSFISYNDENVRILQCQKFDIIITTGDIYD